MPFRSSRAFWTTNPSGADPNGRSRSHPRRSVDDPPSSDGRGLLPPADRSSAAFPSGPSRNGRIFLQAALSRAWTDEECPAWISTRHESHMLTCPRFMGISTANMWTETHPSMLLRTCGGGTWPERRWKKTRNSSSGQVRRRFRRRTKRRRMGEDVADHEDDESTGEIASGRCKWQSRRSVAR